MTQTAVARPLCRDPIRSAWVQTLVDRSIDLLLDEIGKPSLEAIILTGSAARGEASVLSMDHGFRLLGDLEFLVIVRDPLDWPAMRRRMIDVSHQATYDIGAAGHNATIEYGPAVLIYLQRNIRPCIFAYDLRTHGQVVWGQPNILAQIHPFDVGAIPRDDALNLLMNRIMETFSLDVSGSAATPFETQNRAYHRIKLVLDLAGSALAFAGRHASQYRDRSHGFRELLESDPALHDALTEPEQFLSTLDFAIDFKLDPALEHLSSPDLTVLEHLQAVWSRGLWLWEIRQLLGLTTTGFRDALEAYIARESITERLKGWVKFLRHPLRPIDLAVWPRMRRLVFRASPQTLTYAMALLAQAGFAGEVGPDWRQRLTELAPTPISNHSHACMSKDIIMLWQWLIRNN